MRLSLPLLALLTGAFLILACSGDSTSKGETVLAPPEVDVAPTATASPEPTSTPAPTPTTVPNPKLIVLDPGHGGDEVGSATNGVVEKESNLEMALGVEKLLLAQGYEVLLTRRRDSRAAPQIAGYTVNRSDIQARIDLANANGAAVFVSLHSNGSTDPGQRGVEVWYDSSRPFAADNLRLARLLLTHVLGELRLYGYAAQDRGLFDSACWRLRQGRCFAIFVLGGGRETTRSQVEERGGDPEALGFNGAAAHASQPATMPGALVELLIITNANDAAVLRSEGGRQAMARGITAAIVEFLAAKEGG